MAKKLTKEDFLQRANKIHNNKYDYSEVDLEHRDSKNRVKIICPEHGAFWQNIGSHLNGNGCPSCAGLRRMTQDEFLQRAREVHGDRYKYFNDFISTHKKINIECKIHGIFQQTPKNHLKGQGCPECGKIYAKDCHSNDYKHFISSSRERFGVRYDFVDIQKEYRNSHSKITIRCNECGTIFKKIACDHLTSPHGGCPHCYGNKSKGEEDVFNYVKEILPNTRVVSHDRELLNGEELDIFVPEYHVAIEYNGLYWHSEERKGNSYHIQKTLDCEKKGVKLIQIFEDEFLLHQDIVFSKIRHLFGKDTDKPSIMARKCRINKINYEDARVFLDKNHIQGSATATVYLGCFYNKNLVGVMTFVKSSDDEWELNRFATDNSYKSCGIGGKLFAYFKKNYNAKKVKSFADIRWTTSRDNNLYTNLGFKLEKTLKPDYKYVIKGERIHKFNFRKQILHKKYGLSLDLTESEMATQLNAFRIYDCGLYKYIWYNDNKKENTK